MPDFLSAQEFSDWEFCPRLVQLSRTVEPPSFPVRHSIRRYLLRAVRALAVKGGPRVDDVVWDTTQAFLEEAADRGFEHTIPLLAFDRNVYSLLRDYACWLEGAIHLVDEFAPSLAALDPVRIGDRLVLLDCWLDRDDSTSAHTFRVTDRAATTADPPVRWNELLASLDPSIRSITLHSFLLPAPVKDRLASPLVLAYSHPINGHMRLATLDEERYQFTKNWKRTARWEQEGRPDAIQWPEWREGIERDQCIGRCYQESVIDTDTLAPDRQLLAYDTGLIVEELTDQPIAVRRRENCRRCMMAGYCHGDEESRQSYRVISAASANALTNSAATCGTIALP
jgi:hypothetical protein